MNNYISISELAEITGKSKQYYYQQANKKFKQYYRIVKGSKCFDKAILEEFNSTDVKQQVEQNFNSELIKVLQNQLEQANNTIKLFENQLNEKDKQIANLQLLLNQQQQLHQQQLLENKKRKFFFGWKRKQD